MKFVMKFKKTIKIFSDGSTVLSTDKKFSWSRSKKQFLNEDCFYVHGLKRKKAAKSSSAASIYYKKKFLNKTGV